MVEAQYGHFFVLLFSVLMIKTTARIMIASKMTGTIQIMIRCIGCIPKGIAFSNNIFQIEIYRGAFSINEIILA
jgi:hypothetical protein